MSKKQSLTRQKQPVYSDEYKIEAVKMVVEQGGKVTETAQNLGVSERQLYRWINKYSKERGRNRER